MINQNSIVRSGDNLKLRSSTTMRSFCPSGFEVESCQMNKEDYVQNYN